MKLKFKEQDYQLEATKKVIDCFKGQPYRDPIIQTVVHAKEELINGQQQIDLSLDNIDAVINPMFLITTDDILRNVIKIQNDNKIPLNNSIDYKNFSIEMETGTGKTYTYINTMHELYKEYGFSKFIIVVPSIAIREGVAKSIEITLDHFQQRFGQKMRSFVYDSKKPQIIKDFVSTSSLSCIVMNYQAFNARSQDARKIFQELDQFNSQKPIDLLRATQPIMIIDEPQNISDKTEILLEENFKPLFYLRYSATHKKGKEFNKIYTLDALDAYNKKLVKKIEVVGLELVNDKSEGTYIHVHEIVADKKGPYAKIEIEVRTANNITKKVVKVEKRRDLYVSSNEMQAYKGYVVDEIDAHKNIVTFTNGKIAKLNTIYGEKNILDLQQAQIKETIQRHFEKESYLFSKGIKVLSLFFIDKVSNYRDYEAENEQGIFAKIFEEEYNIKVQEILNSDEYSSEYKTYLNNIVGTQTHKGYFSIDKKGKVVDSNDKKNEGSDDIAAYDLILKDKERLLSFEEPTRFIFSHSALREGWDNPNVFQICTLKESKSEIKKRQEIGRGLRICVDKHGNRMDYDALERKFHDYNTLTIIANESYETFSAELQKEMLETLASKRIIVDITNSLMGQQLLNEQKVFTLEFEDVKDLEDHFINKGYIDANNKEATPKFIKAMKDQKIDLPKKYVEYERPMLELINEKIFKSSYPITNAAVKNIKPSQVKVQVENFEKFKDLWQQINLKTSYKISFDNKDLINESIQELNTSIFYQTTEIKITSAAQKNEVTSDELSSLSSFENKRTKYSQPSKNHKTSIKYDLIGEIQKLTRIKRATIIEILKNIEPTVFKQFSRNPELFIKDVSKIINKRKDNLAISKIEYIKQDQVFKDSIFSDDNKTGQLNEDAFESKKGITNYVFVDSKIEKEFFKKLEEKEEVYVYAKMPDGFKIDTPIGSYNPDWALIIEAKEQKHVYFVAETKGNSDISQLRQNEQLKIECAKKHFEVISSGKIKYEVVKDYDELRAKVFNKEID